MLSRFFSIYRSMKISLIWYGVRAYCNIGCCFRAFSEYFTYFWSTSSFWSMIEDYSLLNGGINILLMQVANYERSTSILAKISIRGASLSAINVFRSKQRLPSIKTLTLVVSIKTLIKRGIVACRFLSTSIQKFSIKTTICSDLSIFINSFSSDTFGPTLAQSYCNMLFSVIAPLT